MAEAVTVDCGTGAATTRPLTAAEEADAAARAQRAIQDAQAEATERATRLALRDRLAAYLTDPSPTNAESVAAIKDCVRALRWVVAELRDDG